MKRFFTISLILSCFIAAFFVCEVKAKGVGYEENSLIIKIKTQYQDRVFDNVRSRGRTLLSSLDRLNSHHQVKKIGALSTDENSSLYGSFELTFLTNKNIKALEKEYNNNEFIKYAEPNYKMKLNVFTPNDTYYAQQWGLDKINLPEAWDYDTDSNPYGGDSNIVVAIVDTGVAYENRGSFVKAPDLASTNFVAGYDFVGKDSHPNDDDGHGTSIAEIIAATTNNNKGIAGISYNVSIMPVRVIKHNALASASTVAQGIDFARNNGADVINISLGGEISSEVLYDAIKAADDAGIIIVASTGNDGDSRIYYPAAYPEVISVGASKENNNLASFSNYGEGLDLVAPGESILAEYCVNAPTCSSFQISYISGTSQATPHVTASVALFLSYGASQESVKSYLTNSAKDLGTTGYDTTYGYGLLDLKAAFQLAESDSGAPVTTYSTIPQEPNGNNGYFNSYPRVKLIASDENGIKNTFYRVDSGTWQTYSGMFRVTDGIHLVEYYSKDNLNRSEKIKSIYIYVDTVAPTLNITTPYHNQKIYGDKVNCTGTVSDETSGVISLTVNNTEVEAESSYAKKINVNRGVNNLEYILEDRAGNTKTLDKQVISYRRGDIIVGVGPGELPRVRIHNSSNLLTGEFLPYISFFSGGVNVASGDFDNDGTEEIVTSPISGGGPHIRVLTNRAESVSQFMAFAESFRGGVNIATGDVDGDGNLEIITGAGLTGGPHIRIFDYFGNLKYQFYAYVESFRGGVKVASGDVDGDGIAEIITSPGPGGGPHVRIFDHEGNVKGQFMAYLDSFRGGVNVTAGDLDGDGIAEIITAPFSSGGPHIRTFSMSGEVKGQFFAYIETFRGGFNLSTGDYDNDGVYEIIAGTNYGFYPEVKIFNLDGSFVNNFMGFTGTFRGGVNVAGFN